MQSSAAFQGEYRKGRVSTEGDELYFEVRGRGTPLLMIAGAGGDSHWFHLLAEQLAADHKVITYDRRANARSTAKAPLNFEVSQQTRDALAVLNAADEQSAVVLGVSSGAVIALDLASRSPQAVRTLIAHEPPLVQLHSKRRKWQKFFAGIYATAIRYGSTLAALRFALGAKLPLGAMIENGKMVEAFKQEHASEYVSGPITDEVSFEHELLSVVNYVPDIAGLQRGGVPIHICVGDISHRRKCFYAESSAELARQLNAPLTLFPGHHISFYSDPVGWGAAIRKISNPLAAQSCGSNKFAQEC
jgi:pimeloyl-ACP methyl ester carboxylesterase